MTLAVELERLLEVASGFGTVPMLLSTDENGRPRASAVSVTWDGTVASVRAGRRSLSNAAVRPLVSLLWPAPAGQRFALLVDGEAVDVRPDDAAEAGSDGGTAEKSGGLVTVQVTKAMLHVVDRVPGAAPA
ncbi:MAG TPA: hypothetical protein VFP72_19795 [Kineosporiaceae bacterium]|nr:hypothetical protein [Kineosporiaceae bacterium]